MELGLVELIEQLEMDIARLQESGSRMFTLNTVELELKFVVERTVDAGGKAHWVLFAAEAKGEYKDQHINSIKLNLSPQEQVAFRRASAKS
ncbi:MAG: trypco2 family protein [Candidatus Korobacteraceae bacterium]